MDAGIIFKDGAPLFILTAYTEHVPEALPDGTPGFTAAYELIGRMHRVRAQQDHALSPQDQQAELDKALGDWRPLLARFAADRAPVFIRPRADTNNALRRLSATGARIGVFSDAPLELAEIALAHAGAARQVEVVGTLAEVREALGAEVVVVQSRRQLAELR